MHQQYTLDSAMRRALQLAGNGPADGVNPRVGCVILSPAGEIIAEGWHRGAGTCHAEVDALAQLADFHRRFGFSPTPEHVSYLQL